MQRKLSLKCFSPPVMIATCVIELTLAIYTIWRYKLNEITRLAVCVLINLAIFQLAEYNVCEGAFGIDSLSWARFGYIAITLLPPLGFHLATKLAHDETKKVLMRLAYITATAFAMFFAFSGWGITSQVCRGNYVIFESNQQAMLAYGIYYYGWLIVGTIYSFCMANRLDKRRAGALRALAIGYLSFMLPTTTVNVVDPSTLGGIPSIMCGFAVILAIILAGEVLPRYFRKTFLTQHFARSKNAK